MTGHVCPECGVERPGCACAQAELAAAEDFDPLRIRPYVTLDSTGDGGAYGSEDPGGGAAGGGAAGYGVEDPGGRAAGSHGADDPPTTQLAAVRADVDPVAVTAPVPGAYAAGAYRTEGADGTEGADPAGHRPGGDPSETMPLLLRGVGDIPPPPGHERGQGRGRGRRRGVMVAAVTAVAVAGTAALAAAVLSGGDGGDDRAAVPEVTTSASLNLAVSEAPSPTSGSPEPTSSSPTPERTTSTSASPSPTPSASRTTASPSASASTSGAVAPPASSSSSAPVTAPPTTAPTTTSAPTQSPEEGGEEVVTLSLGSSGSEVRELQRRLTAVWVYDGHINGRYDEEVRDAVARYQSWRYIPGDPEGVYGPDTRRILEENTPEI